MAFPNVLVSAGELSGDLYACYMVRALRDRWGEAVHFWGMGGPEMAAAGVDVVVPLHTLQVHGVAEVLPRLGHLFRAFRRLVLEAERRRPTWALLVDFQDFHLRLARELKRRGIRVVQMVAPTVWAWRSQRIHTLRRVVDKLLVIFPFEEPLFREAGVDATFIGHPLMDIIRVSMDRNAFLRTMGWTEDVRVIGLLPGSRPQEVRRLLPIMLEALSRIRDRLDRVEAFLVRAPTVPRTLIESIVRAYGSRLPVVQGREKYDWMANADILVVASGTATLEGLLVRTPMVVVYRMHPISWWLARRLVRVRHASMVNILARETVVPELLQKACAPDVIARTVCHLLKHPPALRRMIERYLEIIDDLGCLHPSEEGPRVIEEAIRQWAIPWPVAPS